MALSKEEIAELEALENLEAQELSAEETEELAQLEQKDYEESSTASEAALLGSAQGVTLNHADEMLADDMALYDKVQSVAHNLGLADKSPSQIDKELIEQGFTGDLEVDAYKSALQDTRQMFKDAKEEHPVAFTAGEIGGGLLLPGPTTIKAASKAPALIKSGTSLAGIASLSAVDELGRSEEDEFEAQFSDALYGGLTGVASYGIFKGVGKGAKKAGSFLKEEAQGLAERSMGIFNMSARKAFRKNLEAKGKNAEEFVEDVFTQVDVNGKPLLSTFKNQQSILDDSRLRMDQLGEDMGSIVKEVQVRSGEIKISNKEMSDHIVSKLTDKYMKDPTLTNQMKEANKVIERFAIKAEQPDSNLSDVVYWKNSLLSDFSKNADRPFTKASDVERDAISEISNYVEMKVKSVSQDNDLISKFKQAKRDFGTLAEYSKYVQKSVDYDEKGTLGKVAKSLAWAPLAMATGASVGSGAGALTGLAVGAALKTASKSPVLQRNASKAAMAVGTFLEKSPNQDFLQRLGLSAARSYDDFVAELDVLHLKTQGFITDPGEAEMLREQVNSSPLPPRQKIEANNQINEGRVPQQPSEPQSPFVKVYRNKDRSKGIKDTDY